MPMSEIIRHAKTEADEVVSNASGLEWGIRTRTMSNGFMDETDGLLP